MYRRTRIPRRHIHTCSGRHGETSGRHSETVYIARLASPQTKKLTITTETTNGNTYNNASQDLLPAAPSPQRILWPPPVKAGVLVTPSPVDPEFRDPRWAFPGELARCSLTSAQGCSENLYGDLTTSSPTIISNSPRVSKRYIEFHPSVNSYIISNKSSIYLPESIAGELVAKSPFEECLRKETLSSPRFATLRKMVPRSSDRDAASLRHVIIIIIIIIVVCIIIIIIIIITMVIIIIINIHYIYIYIYSWMELICPRIDPLRR